MTDILLAHAYYLRNDPLEQRIMRPYVPLGYLYLSSYLKEQGFSPEVYDSTWREPADFARELDRLRPPLIGIYANIVTRPVAHEMTRLAKDRNIPVVIGGPDGFTRRAQHFEAGADFVIKGEGELTLTELMQALADGARPGDELSIPGLTYLRDGREVVGPERTKIPHLDELPWPDRAAVDLTPYFDNWRRVHGETSLNLITARGCPYSCSWCSRQVFGKSHRQRTPSKVVDELLHLKETYRPDKLWISDDVLTMKRRWVLELVEEMKSRDAVIPFEGITRVNLLDEELIDALRSAGCFRLWFGAESGVQRIVDRMKKGYKVERIIEATRQAQRAGIQVGHFIMLGYPTETRKDVVGTIRFLDEARPDLFGTSVAFPLEGTAFYEEVADDLVENPNATSGMNSITYRSRYPHSFYWLAVRWVNAEVAFRKAWRQGAVRNLPRVVKLGAKTLVGRVTTWILAQGFAGRLRRPDSPPEPRVATSPR